MTQTFVSVAFFLVLLALLPVLIRWWQRRSGGGAPVLSSTRVVSATALGPHQKIVTVEVGPQDGKVLLVLGVTNQSISTLHVFPVAAPVKVGGVA